MAGDIEILQDADDGIPSDPSCSDDGSSDTAEDNLLDITGMANDTVYPPSYIKEIADWLKFDFNVNASPTTGSTPSPTPCVGNQVQGSCVAATLPSATPFSGPETPVCSKADGSEGSLPRLNATVALEAASRYCQNLVDDKVILAKDGGSPKAGVEPGAAEGGADMALAVVFREEACPEDHSISEVDFGKLGPEGCFDLLYTQLEQACSQDSTWADYDPEWTFQGGVWAGQCGMFGIYSQDAS